MFLVDRYTLVNPSK